MESQRKLASLTNHSLAVFIVSRILDQTNWSAKLRLHAIERLSKRPTIPTIGLLIHFAAIQSSISNDDDQDDDVVVVVVDVAIASNSNSNSQI